MFIIVWLSEEKVGNQKREMNYKNGVLVIEVDDIDLNTKYADEMLE